MNYAKINEGVLEYAPVNYTTASGSLIVNFNKNATLMKRYGFKEVIDQRPSYDELTEYLTISGYTETEDNIIINYAVRQIEIVKPIEEKIELLEDENKKIKEVNNTQDILIDITMMATDEVYTMLEPILEMIPQKTMSLERSVSKMVDMYVAMVQRDLKTIDQVPARYREEVARILAELEK